MTRRSGFHNRAAERNHRYGRGAGVQMGKVPPSARLLALIDRFFTSDTFPLDAWLATHETPAIRRRMAAMAALPDGV